MKSKSKQIAVCVLLLLFFIAEISFARDGWGGHWGGDRFRREFNHNIVPIVGTDTLTFLTLSDLYNKLIDNNYSVSDHTISITSEPSSSMYTLEDIWNAIPIVPSGIVLNSTSIMGIQGNYNVSNLNPDNVVAGTLYGTSSVGTLTDSPREWVCGDSFADIRDSKIYPTVSIGSQCWMAKNLNIGTYMVAANNSQGTNCSSINKYCNGDNESICDTYGGIYEWGQVMCGSTSEGVQGICPTGWHIPSDAEWCAMEQGIDSLISCDSTGVRGVDIGARLRTGGSTGFNTQYSGNFAADYDNQWHGLDSLAYIWTSTGIRFDMMPPMGMWVDGPDAMVRSLSSGWDGIDREQLQKINGFSVRCIKDQVI